MTRSTVKQSDMSRSGAPLGGRAQRAVPIGDWNIDKTNNEPIYLQLVRSIKRQIEAGTISADSILPSSRKLSTQLKLSRSTVVAAYELLTSEGLLDSRPGSTTVVKRNIIARDGRAAHSSHAGPSASPFSRPSILTPRIAPLDHISGSAWRRVLSQDLATITSVESASELRLRQNLASYLALSRRIQCGAENILVLASIQQALNLTAKFARDSNIVCNFEPWGAERTRATFASEGAGGATLSRLACDLPESEFAAFRNNGVFLTPSHHYPLSTTMSLEPRVNFAERADSYSLWIIEDARDAEFLKSQHLPTFYELRGGHRTLHIGTMSTVLMPFVQLAYVVAEPSVINRLSAKRFLFDDIPLATLDVASELLETGMFHAATRAARQLADRRCALFYSLAARHGFWSLPKREDQQGLHGILWFRSGIGDLLRVRTDLLSLDSQIELVRRESHDQGPEIGLVVGFAATPDHLIAAQVSALAEVVSRSRLA